MLSSSCTCWSTSHQYRVLEDKSREAIPHSWFPGRNGSLTRGARGQHPALEARLGAPAALGLRNHKVHKCVVNSSSHPAYILLLRLRTGYSATPRKSPGRNLFPWRKPLPSDRGSLWPKSAGLGGGESGRLCPTGAAGEGRLRKPAEVTRGGEAQGALLPHSQVVSYPFTFALKGQPSLASRPAVPREAVLQAGFLKHASTKCWPITGATNLRVKYTCLPPCTP